MNDGSNIVFNKFVNLSQKIKKNMFNAIYKNKKNGITQLLMTENEIPVIENTKFLENESIVVNKRMLDLEYYNFIKKDMLIVENIFEVITAEQIIRYSKKNVIKKIKKFFKTIDSSLKITIADDDADDVIDIFKSWKLPTLSISEPGDIFLLKIIALELSNGTIYDLLNEKILNKCYEYDSLSIGERAAILLCFQYSYAAPNDYRYINSDAFVKDVIDNIDNPLLNLFLSAAEFLSLSYHDSTLDEDIKLYIAEDFIKPDILIKFLKNKKCIQDIIFNTISKTSESVINKDVFYTDTDVCENLSFFYNLKKQLLQLNEIFYEYDGDVSREIPSLSKFRGIEFVFRYLSIKSIGLGKKIECLSDIHFEKKIFDIESNFFTKYGNDSLLNRIDDAFGCLPYFSTSTHIDENYLRSSLLSFYGRKKIGEFLTANEENKKYFANNVKNFIFKKNSDLDLLLNRNIPGAIEALLYGIDVLMSKQEYIENFIKPDLKDKTFKPFIDKVDSLGPNKLKEFVLDIKNMDLMYYWCGRNDDYGPYIDVDITYILKKIYPELIFDDGDTIFSILENKHDNLRKIDMKDDTSKNAFYYLFALSKNGVSEELDMGRPGIYCSEYPALNGDIGNRVRAICMLYAMIFSYNMCNVHTGYWVDNDYIFKNIGAMTKFVKRVKFKRDIVNGFNSNVLDENGHIILYDKSNDKSDAILSDVLSEVKDYSYYCLDRYYDKMHFFAFQSVLKWKRNNSGFTDLGVDVTFTYEPYVREQKNKLNISWEYPHLIHYLIGVTKGHDYEFNKRFSNINTIQTKDSFTTSTLPFNECKCLLKDVYLNIIKFEDLLKV